MNIVTVLDRKAVKAANFHKAVEEGRVSFFILRENGTLRRTHYLTGEGRVFAEWVKAKRQGGATMREISKESHLSIPTLRRFLNELILTEAIEEMKPLEAYRKFAKPAKDKPHSTPVRVVASNS